MKILQKLTALLLLSLSLSSFAAIDALNFDSPAQEKDYHALTQELRCPQCQNNNIADSNATIAVDMRHKVFELLQEGKSKQDVVNYMVERYGNFVTYDPPITAATLILWIAPILLVLIGIFMLFRRRPQVQQKSAGQNTVDLTQAEKQRLEKILNGEKQ
nr:cytochrome c-type biogenesis protein [Conservatibacter flavescens]